jgi:hypothetical protein
MRQPLSSRRSYRDVLIAAALTAALGVGTVCAEPGAAAAPPRRNRRLTDSLRTARLLCGRRVLTTWHLYPGANRIAAPRFRKAPAVASGSKSITRPLAFLVPPRHRDLRGAVRCTGRSRHASDENQRGNGLRPVRDCAD